MNDPARILIVDDIKINRDILATPLSAQGYQLVEAADGEEALAVARKNLPDLILLDVMMPKIDGIEVCRRLKADNSLSLMPIILVTARGESKDVVAGLEAGADEYLVKPIDQMALLARVKSMLKQKQFYDQVQKQAAELALVNMRLQRERDNKLMSLEAMAASISHEVKQPLGAIATNGSAALRYLGREPPNLEEVRSALNGIVRDSHRASSVFESIRALFGKPDLRTEPVDMNNVVLAVLRDLRDDLKGHGVTAHSELTSGLPLVTGDRAQLQQVLHNLIQNAIDAMDAIRDKDRVLFVRTELHDSNAVAISVQDSGPGIDPQKIRVIFDAFVTTKSRGMGLGLAICQMIAQRHGGQLLASSEGVGGSLFQLILPLIDVS